MSMDIPSGKEPKNTPPSGEQERTDDEFRVLVEEWVARSEAHFAEPDYNPDADMGISHEINEFHKAMLRDPEMLHRHNEDLNADIRQKNALIVAGYREVGVDEARVLLAKELEVYDQAGFADDPYVQNLRRMHESGLDGFIEQYADMINGSALITASKVAGIDLEQNAFEAILSQFSEFIDHQSEK
ncbi:MAG: hypothetical protein JWN75_101 [Candidatus Saccharibacteria bacterium]|nr:hypothetical protein [Candidatus Saccharibacteria bacterium]